MRKSKIRTSATDHKRQQNIASWWFEAFPKILVWGSHSPKWMDSKKTIQAHSTLVNILKTFKIDYIPKKHQRFWPTSPYSFFFFFFFRFALPVPPECRVDSYNGPPPARHTAPSGWKNSPSAGQSGQLHVTSFCRNIDQRYTKPKLIECLNSLAKKGI